MVRWEICTLAAEAPSLLFAWTAHHLSLGVDLIRLHLDRPIPEVTAALSGHPRVQVTVCDTAFWKSRGDGTRPHRQGLRQRAILQEVVDSADSEWVFHIDCDEFLFCNGAIAEQLAQQPASVEHVGVQALERVHPGQPDPADILAGIFRLKTPNRALSAAADADGPAAPYLQRGMTAYCGGKSAFRSRCGLTTGIHGPKPAKPETAGHVAGIMLLHFDGLTPRHWVSKRLRLMSQQPRAIENEVEHRRHQLAHMLANRDNAVALDRFYHSLKCLDADREAALDQLGLLRRPDLNVRKALAAEFPTLDVDLGASTFDAFRII